MPEVGVHHPGDHLLEGTLLFSTADIAAETVNTRNETRCIAMPPCAGTSSETRLTTDARHTRAGRKGVQFNGYVTYLDVSDNEVKETFVGVFINLDLLVIHPK